MLVWCSKIAAGEINNKGIMIGFVVYKLFGSINNSRALETVVAAEYMIDV